MKISIIVPCYNEENYIIKVLRENICDEINKTLLHYDVKNNLEKDINLENVYKELINFLKNKKQILKKVKK